MNARDATGTSSVPVGMAPLHLSIAALRWNCDFRVLFEVPCAWATEATSVSASSFPLPMPEPKLNRARERRIELEIVIDAYTPEESAMGWYYYLEEKLKFPFKAKCVSARSVSPLTKGEEVEVVAMAKEDDCMREPFVLIRFAGRKLGVPLSQLAVSKTARETHQAVEDWRYWVAMGYEF